MHERHRALTPALAGCYEEAASVCLSERNSPPIEIELSDNGKTHRVTVSWNPPDFRTLDAHANTIDATEFGAYGCVIAGVELSRGIFAVRRAETGTGADYYVGPADSGIDDLEDCSRLEVSGVREGDYKLVAKRLAEKVDQVRRGKSNLPALAGVMGFSAKALLVKDVVKDQ